MHTQNSQESRHTRLARAPRQTRRLLWCTPMMIPAQGTKAALGDLPSSRRADAAHTQTRETQIVHPRASTTSMMCMFDITVESLLGSALDTGGWIKITAKGGQLLREEEAA